MTAVAGGYAFKNIPIDAFPNISPVQVKMILKAPGMTPEEVETRVITPIEMELLGIPRQTILRSAAKYAIADITLDFEDGTDIYWARQQVAERLAGVRDQLACRTSPAVWRRFRRRCPTCSCSPSTAVICRSRSAAACSTGRSGRRCARFPASPTSTPSAAWCARSRSFPNRARLAAARLGVDDILTAIDEGNRNDGAGRLSEGEKALVVRAAGAIQNA